MAVIGGNIEIVQLLKHNGIKVGSMGLLKLIGVLKLSIRYCRYDIANWIYDSMDMSTCNMCNYIYSYWLMHANNNTILTKLMNLSKQSNISFGIIMESRNSSDMLGFIIENSTSFPNIVINGKDFQTISIFKEHTVIDWALINNRIDILDVLIAKGANINAGDKYGFNTPLRVAVQRDNLSIVQYLVEKGADVNDIYKYGQTLLNIAKLRWHKEVVDYLIAH